MMTSKSAAISRKVGLSVIILFFSCINLFAQTENPKWIIAAQKFGYSKGQSSNAITEATAEMLPSRILEKIGQNLIRNVSPDERLDRFTYESKKDRISLFLQLSSAYKKRDAIMLNDYSEREIRKKISEEEKNIQSIQDKIDENLAKLKEEQEKTEKLNGRQESAITEERKEKGELFKYSALVKNLFVKNESVFTSEDISFYSNDISAFFNPSEKAAKSGYLSYLFEKECINAKINTLLTGTITAYGDYLSVTIEVYHYPNAKLLGTVTEVGSVDDYESLATSIANELLPLITNALPVKLNIQIEPEVIASEVEVYIDDQLQESIANCIVDSGVHTMQFAKEGYKSAATSYYFEGNKNYLIQVQLEEQQIGSLLVGIDRSPLSVFYQNLPLTPNFSDEGKVYYNGVHTEKDEEGRSKIIINGNKILGQFVSEDGTGDFFYVPPKLLYDSSAITIAPKNRDRSKYIDNRRKMMYASYSIFIVSLIPSFYCYGSYENMAKRWNSFVQDGLLTREDYEKAKKMEKATRTTAAISVGCGVFFGFELFRYFEAANSVLPKKAKKAKNEIKPIEKIETEEPVETEVTEKE